MGQYDDDGLFGPLLLSAFFNTYLFGLLCLQYATYRSTPFNDRPLLRAVVCTMFSLDVSQSALLRNLPGVGLMCKLLSYIQDREWLWMYSVMPLFTSFSGLLVHLFLAKKILDLTKGRLVSYALMLVGFASCGLGSAMAIFGLAKNLSVSQLVNGSPPHQTLALVWLSVQSVLNFTLAGGLIYLYDKMGNRIWNILPHFAKTWGIIVKCNTFGTLFCLLALILAVVSPKSGTWFALLMPLGRLYSATVLTWLLAREKSQDLSTRSFHPTTTKMQWRVPTNFSRTESFKVIQIQTEREVVVDSSVFVDRTSGSKEFHSPLPDASDEEIHVLESHDGV